jgi:hypothetical protein
VFILYVDGVLFYYLGIFELISQLIHEIKFFSLVSRETFVVLFNTSSSDSMGLLTKMTMKVIILCQKISVKSNFCCNLHTVGRMTFFPTSLLK